MQEQHGPDWIWLAKNMNWYKTSQLNENYYTIEIARDPNTSSEILKKILEQGNDDWVSYYAVKNPNCPPEALEMVLKRGNDDNVSYYAVQNPNCPVEALEMILEQGKDDGVSRHAAYNLNCPASALEMVLKRGKDDGISRYAAYNPNCPALAKIKWMQSVGIIGKEDPSKHIIEREEIEYKEDPDLKKLRDLISKSNSWYKTAELDYSDITKDFPPISEEEQNHIKNMKNKWIYVQSSFIQCVAYFEPLKLFEVKLKNGKTYEYSNISKELFDQFMASDSKGKFLNKIRNRF